MPVVPYIDLQFAADAESVAAARHSSDKLQPVLETAQLANVALLVTELLTNSVRHGGLDPDARIGLKVFLFEAIIRVEVSDPGPCFTDALTGPRSDGSGGWGLHMVERLADRWGHDRHEDLCLVWFEMSRHG